MMTKITAVVITQDEERNIGRCIASLQGVADEIVVVDSGSTDDTEKICISLGVRFIPHAWEGYAEQKNYANTLASNKWVLSIDADEELDANLRAAIQQLKARELDENCIYSFNRLANYCGQWIRHVDGKKDICKRLWMKDNASWSGHIHETLQYKKPLKEVILKGRLNHYSYYTIKEHAQRLTKYASMSAKMYYEQGKRCSTMAIVVRPMWTFLRSYLLRGGFLDGAMGFTICRMSAFYTLIKYATLYNLCQQTDK